MKIYLASPLFNEIQKDKIKKVVNRLRREGHEVYSPMEHQIPNAWALENYVWSKKVFDEDLRALNEADAVYAIYYGMDSDSGTAWEIGYACAMKKQVKVFVSDEKNLQSLMIINGANNVYALAPYIDHGEKKPIWLKKIIQS